MFCKKLDNLKNYPTEVLQKFYAKMPTLPASDDITRFDGTYKHLGMQNEIKISDDTQQFADPKLLIPDSAY